MTVEVPLLLMLLLVAEENAEGEMLLLLLVSEPVEVMVVLLLKKETVEEESEAREEKEEVETVSLLLLELELVETGSELVGEATLEVLVNGMLLLGDDDGPTVGRDEVVLLLLTGEVLLGDVEAVDDVVPLFGTEALVDEAVLFGGRLVEETEGPLVGGTVLELFVNGILLLEDGPTVEEAVLLPTGEVLLGDNEAVLFVVGTELLLAPDALAEEAVLFGNRLLLDGALLVGTLPVEDAVVPLEDTDDDVGRLPVDEAVLFTKGELVGALLVGTLPVDEAEVPFEDADDVGVLVMDEVVLFARPVELDAPLVERPTVDVPLAREELASVDDAVLIVPGVVLGTPLVEAAEVGVTVPLLEGEVVGTVVPVEEAVLLREPVLEDMPLPDGAVD